MSFVYLNFAIEPQFFDTFGHAVKNPIILIGKYELSLNDEFVFIKEDLDKELEPMSILCHRKLKEIFPEMDFEDLQRRLMSNLRYSVKDKVATCRYELCR